jgi:photosystem II stability/assembly factor-like uncharacterized protein
MLAVTREGPCEADLVRAANGDILCAMRANGQPGNTGPSFISRSCDEGQTWSKPTLLLDRGVWPNLTVMRNGVVVCTTGRDGNWLVFSRNHGHTWEDALCFYNGGGYPATSSYNTVLEVARDVLLVIYDRNANTSSKGPPRHEIVGTFFTVRSKSDLRGSRK